MNYVQADHDREIAMLTEALSCTRQDRDKLREELAQEEKNNCLLKRDVSRANHDLAQTRKINDVMAKELAECNGKWGEKLDEVLTYTADIQKRLNNAHREIDELRDRLAGRDKQTDAPAAEKCAAFEPLKGPRYRTTAERLRDDLQQREAFLDMQNGTAKDASIYYRGGYGPDVAGCDAKAPAAGSDECGYAEKAPGHAMPVAGTSFVGIVGTAATYSGWSVTIDTDNVLHVKKAA